MKMLVGVCINCEKYNISCKYALQYNVSQLYVMYD